MSSHGDQAKTVKRPSCDATSASPSRWSWMNCAADRCRVPPSCAGATTAATLPSIGSVSATRSTGWPAAAPHDLRAERQQFVAVGHDRRAVHRRQAGDRVDHALHGLAAMPVWLPRPGSSHQVAQARERGLEAVGDRLDDRVAPRGAAGRDDQQQAAAPVRAHRHGELHEHVRRLHPRTRRVEPDERGEEVRDSRAGSTRARPRSSPGRPRAPPR